MKQTNYHLFDFMDFDPSMQIKWSVVKPYDSAKKKKKMKQTNYHLFDFMGDPSLQIK